MLRYTDRSASIVSAPEPPSASPPASCAVGRHGRWRSRLRRFRSGSRRPERSDSACAPDWCLGSGADVEQRRADETDPYMNGLDPADRGSRGRSGSNPAVSLSWDLPRISSGVDTLLDEFEINAYCGGGKNRGRYLGKTFWIYKVTPGGATAMRDPRRGPDLGGPTPEFAKADSLWRKERGFSLPRSSPPSKGGIPCP